MPFDTAEKRFSAIHLTKRSGLPPPTGHLGRAQRLHLIGIFSTVAAVSTVTYFWSNRSLIAGLWSSKSAPSSTWSKKASPSTQWGGKVSPPDSRTKEI